jgi:uncharacterized protein (DUF697 family)
MTDNNLALPADSGDSKNRGADAISHVLLDIAGHVPHSAQSSALQPLQAARTLTQTAANKAAMVSGSLALAPGPFGLLTVLPDLVAVWRIQSQMVSDIAAVYGQSATLTTEHMLYCLFKHSAAQAVRDLAVRAGERWVIRQASGAVLQTIVKRLGTGLSQKVVGSSAARFVPLLGAVGVGGYAFYDTRQVAASAIALFEAQADNLAQGRPKAG